jgi:hypothetical protein
MKNKLWYPDISSLWKTKYPTVISYNVGDKIDNCILFEGVFFVIDIKTLINQIHIKILTEKGIMYFVYDIRSSRGEYCKKYFTKII